MLLKIERKSQRHMVVTIGSVDNLICFLSQLILNSLGLRFSRMVMPSLAQDFSDVAEY